MVIKLQPFTVDDIITVGIAVNFMEEQGTVRVSNGQIIFSFTQF